MSTPAARLEAARRLPEGIERAAAALPGLGLALVAALAATYLSERLALGAMVFALFIGMGFNPVLDDPRFRPGIDLAARAILRIGVALLGLRILAGDVASLGAGAVALAASGIALTIALGVFLARRLGLGNDFGILSGGAVAICGVSAAMAINSILPRHADSDRDATFVAVTVTALSTLAMLAYPVATGLAGFSDRASGIFFGATIHDVAHVVGAGYSLSAEAGDMGTIMKLLRVAMLLPVCIAIGMALQARRGKAARVQAGPIVPWFVAAFAALVLLRTAGWAPAPVVELGGVVSQWCLVVAMAAIGMKTSLRALVRVGPRATLLIVVETAFLAALVFAAAAWLGSAAGF
jgi:uncharacterized integral membrane protein (TIGR00698 family)